MRVKNLAIDITEVEYNGQNEIIIAHGVNCQGVMGSGVARALYEKWPTVKSEYLKLPKRARTLGRIQPVSVEKGITVFNCFTQEFYGNDGAKYADPEAIETCVRAVLKYIEEMEMRKPMFYIPRIGTGYGGLDWKTEVASRVATLGREYNDSITMVICTQ